MKRIGRIAGIATALFVAVYFLMSFITSSFDWFRPMSWQPVDRICLVLAAAWLTVLSYLIEESV